MENNLLDPISILLVDDEQGLCEMLTAVLKKEGFRLIRSAGTGSEALQILAETVIDVIVVITSYSIHYTKLYEKIICCHAEVTDPLVQQDINAISIFPEKYRVYIRH